MQLEPNFILSQLHDFQPSCITKPTRLIQSFIKKLYSEEPDPIFEQNWIHICSYLKFKSQLFVLRSSSFECVAILNSDSFFIFAPKILIPSIFLQELQVILKQLGQVSLKVVNVSENWVIKYIPEISQIIPSTQITPRSKEEAIYDLELLVKLEGKRFSHLRSIRNQLLTSGKVDFQPLTKDHLASIDNLIIDWNQVQGLKYSKDKQEKELFTFQQLLSFTPSHPEVQIHGGFYNQKLYSVAVFFVPDTHPKWAINYILKGINRSSENGLHGISDATYLHVINTLYNQGVKYLNDGELGSELGTREHKLRFQPFKFLKSFDILIPLHQ